MRSRSLGGGKSLRVSVRAEREIGSQNRERPSARESRPSARWLEQPARRFDPEDALGVARYVADMIPQLEAMAIKGRLDLVTYFLGMARAEADRFAQTEVSTGETSNARGELREDEGVPQRP